MRFAAFALLLWGSAGLRGQDAEAFRVELTASAWRTSVRGEVQAGGLPVDLHSDLDLRDRWTFFGRLVVKPGRRHRIVIEGAPYRFEGVNRLERTIQYAGRTYVISEEVESEATLGYFYGGYQFDVISRPRGHFGISGGAAWLDAAGEIRSVARGVTGRHDESFPIPLAGLDGRAWLIANRLYIGGDVKGMSLGRYGHYVQGAGHVGLRVAGPLHLVASLPFLDSDVHEEEGGSGVRPRITGPMFSVQFRK